MVDIDMYQLIEKGMRGGVPYIANRYGKANNKYMKSYDEIRRPQSISCISMLTCLSTIKDKRAVYDCRFSDLIRTTNCIGSLTS